MRSSSWVRILDPGRGKNQGDRQTRAISWTHTHPVPPQHDSLPCCNHAFLPEEDRYAPRRARFEQEETHIPPSQTTITQDCSLSQPCRRRASPSPPLSRASQPGAKISQRRGIRALPPARTPHSSAPPSRHQHPAWVWCLFTAPTCCIAPATALYPPTARRGAQGTASQTIMTGLNEPGHRREARCSTTTHLRGTDIFNAPGESPERETLDGIETVAWKLSSMGRTHKSPAYEKRVTRTVSRAAGHASDKPHG